MHDPVVVASIPPTPEGKVRLCEFGQQPLGSMAEQTTLDFRAKSNLFNGHPVSLLYRSRGYVIAGSCLRWSDKEMWGVSFSDIHSNTTYGKWYLSEAEASEQWRKVT